LSNKLTEIDFESNDCKRSDRDGLSHVI
jgi:hypothetical protein